MYHSSFPVLQKAGFTLLPLLTDDKTRAQKGCISLAQGH